MGREKKPYCIKKKGDYYYYKLPSKRSSVCCSLVYCSVDTSDFKITFFVKIHQEI